uniref:alpha-N-acetylgalactosaminide alpha-2,6-sialyltransferase n=1 Tax=Salarias fasciatus TaxID=181472 RepID=A0A672H5S8_SALFA
MPVLSKKAHKKLPQWDFEEVYNQDAPPRPTVSIQAQKNAEISGLFCFFCLFAEVMTAAKLIPRPSEPLLRPKPGGDGCVHCAVVGTAGILNGSKVGAEIDSHDYVFRMNGAITEGYEEDVGNRTSVCPYSSGCPAYAFISLM